MLRDIDENGGVRDMDDIDYRERFDRKWNEFTPEAQRAIDTEINRLLDALIDDPDPNWGSIMNTSIEGGKVNPFSGLPGDWTGTPWQPIWERNGQSDERIIERPEQWIGIRNTEDCPTFPNRGINLAGKTYFLANRS